MANIELKAKAVSNMAWRLAERCGAQGVTFLVSVVLARILEPELYGTVALVTAFMAIIQVFVDGGLGLALIQKSDADGLDFSTVFYANMGVCLASFGVLYLAAPFIALFYNDSQLTAIIRVLSLNLIIYSLKNVQQAHVSRTLQFKRFFFSTLGGTLGAAMVGIVLAISGFGIWALVIQQLFNNGVDTLILWITAGWKPTRQFSYKRLRTLFSYGWKLLLSSLLDTIYNNLRQILIGKNSLSSDLAFYNRGRQFPELIVSNVNSSIDSVLFPVLSSSQENKEVIKAMTRRSVQLGSFFVWPVMVGLFVCGETLVRLVLTDKWLPCVPYLQVFCFIYGFWPFHTANLNAIKALGRSDIFLKLEIEKKIIGLISILISLPFGVWPMVLAYAVTAPVSAVLNALPNRTLIHYSLGEQVSDSLLPFLVSVLMGVCVSLISRLCFLPDGFVKLLVLFAVGAVVYIGAAWIFRLEAFRYLIGLLIERKKQGFY